MFPLQSPCSHCSLSPLFSTPRPSWAESPCNGHRHPNWVSSFECQLRWARGWLLAGCMCLNQILKWASLNWGWSSLDPTPLLVLSMTQVHLISVTTPPTVPLMTTAFVLTAATVCDLVVSLLNSSHVAGPLLPARSKSSMLLFCHFTHWPCCRYRIPWTALTHPHLQMISVRLCSSWPLSSSTTNVINCSCKM